MKEAPFDRLRMHFFSKMATLIKNIEGWEALDRDAHS
jgi:hypothetical protein